MTKLNIELPANFFEGEERNGHFISPEMKKVWAVEFDLLNEFTKVCQKHNLQWWADGGTLLGAVRHKGMIPWDDDIDVIMMREDYIKLCNVATEEFKHPYFFQTEETDKWSFRGHAQLRNSNTTGILKSELKKKYTFNQGIFIDIFPLDVVPDDDVVFQEQAKKIHYYRRKASEYRRLTYCYKLHFRRNIFKLFTNYVKHLLAIGPLRSHFDYTKQYKLFVAEGQRYNGTNSKRVCKMYFGIKPRHIWQRRWFDETIYLPFEFFQVPAPKGYKELLDKFYGDWHVCKKVATAHGGCLFDTDKPYTEYIK